MRSDLTSRRSEPATRLSEKADATRRVTRADIRRFST
jgi:hypothetical protein